MRSVSGPGISRWCHRLSCHKNVAKDHAGFFLLFNLNSALFFFFSMSFKIRHKKNETLQLIYLTLVCEDLVPNCNLNCSYPPKTETSKGRANASFSAMKNPAVRWMRSKPLWECWDLLIALVGLINKGKLSNWHMIVGMDVHLCDLWKSLKDSELVPKWPKHQGGNWSLPAFCSMCGTSL